MYAMKYPVLSADASNRGQGRGQGLEDDESDHFDECEESGYGRSGRTEDYGMDLRYLHTTCCTAPYVSCRICVG